MWQEERNNCVYFLLVHTCWCRADWGGCLSVSQCLPGVRPLYLTLCIHHLIPFFFWGASGSRGRLPLGAWQKSLILFLGLPRWSLQSGFVNREWFA
jgi:hypothetical protein